MIKLYVENPMSTLSNNVAGLVNLANFQSTKNMEPHFHMRACWKMKL